MSTLRVDQITDEDGTGAPDFPNGLTGLPQLTQTQAEDPTSTVFGTVSGQRLAQAAGAEIERRYAASTLASAVAGTTYSFTHGLGAAPRLVVAVLICNDPIYDYVVGDEIYLPHGYQGTPGSWGSITVGNATTARVRINVSQQIGSVVSGAYTAGTPSAGDFAKFDLQIRCWL